MRALLGTSVVLLLLSRASATAASPLFELVGDTLSDGGFNARVRGASSASGYFNPALLPQAKQGLELGWLVLNDAISITLDGRNPAVDIPESAVDRFGTDNPSVPTTWLENGCTPSTGRCVQELAPHPRQGEGSSGQVRAYQALGLVNHIWPKYLSVAFYALVPLRAFTQAHSFFVDEREQFFTNSLHPELYADRLTPVSLAFGVGSKPLDWLSLGLSFTMSIGNTANAGTYVGNSAKISETLQLSTKVDVAASVSPHGGILIEPLDSLDIAFTVHSPQKMVIDTAFGTYLPNGDLQWARRPATHSYQPWIVGLALAYDLTKAWSLAGTVTYERWSQYVDRQTARPLPGYEWSDVFSESLGVHYQSTHWKTSLDAVYHPSPVPLQTGRTNYVDNNRFGATAAVSYDWPIPKWDVVFRFGARAQAHLLQRRYQAKIDPSAPGYGGQHHPELVVDEWPDGVTDISTGQPITEAKGLQTNNPGWPGFASQGFLLGGSLSLSLLY
jgi:long-chain fatty acid transport protein